MRLPDNELTRGARRFAWIGLAAYGALSLGQWLGYRVGAFGPMTEYTIEVSIIGAIVIGGLYAVAWALRPQKLRQDSRPTGPS